MKKIAFFDLDNTLYKGYSAIDFILFLVQKGIGTADHKSELEKTVIDYQSGKISYAEASRVGIHLVATIVAGMQVSDVLKLKHEFVVIKERFFTFVPELMKLLKEAQFQPYIISAGPAPCVEVLAQSLGVTNFFASDFEITADRYTGSVVQMLNHDAKQTLVEDILNSHVDDIFSLGFGDSTGDVEMLSAVNQAFVINPHQPEMTDLVKANNWHLVTEDTILAAVRSVLPEV